MFHLNEIAAFVIMLGVTGFVAANRGRLRALPAWRLLLSGFLAFLAAGLFSLLELLPYYSAAEALEQAAYTGGNLLLVAWCWKVLARGRSRG